MRGPLQGLHPPLSQASCSASSSLGSWSLGDPLSGSPHLGDQLSHPRGQVISGRVGTLPGGQGGGSKCQGEASLWRLPTERPMLGDCGVCSRQDSPRVVLGTPGDLYLGPSQCWGYPGRWVVCAVISCPFPVLRLLWNPLPQAMWADSWLQVSPWTPGWSGNSWSHFSMAGTPGWVRTDDGARLWSGGLSKCLILTQKMALPT